MILITILFLILRMTLPLILILQMTTLNHSNDLPFCLYFFRIKCLNQLNPNNLFTIVNPSLTSCARSPSLTPLKHGYLSVSVTYTNGSITMNTNLMLWEMNDARGMGMYPFSKWRLDYFDFILFSSVFGFKCPSTVATYRWNKFLIFWIRRYKNLWPNVVLSVSNSKRYVMLLDTSGLYQHIPKRKIQPKYFNSWKVSSLFYKVLSILNVNMT
jgi:hypothetical protein